MQNPNNSWQAFDHEDQGISKPVFFSGDGPPIIVIHELPGMIPECVAFAERLRSEGFTVYLPLLFGKPNNKVAFKLLWLKYPIMMCIRKELYLFKKNKTSPIMDWLRSLSQHIHHKHGEEKVGAIGMCMTGGFVVPLIVDEFMAAPVMSQPAFPPKDEDLGVSPETLESAQKRCEAGTEIKVYRFSEDKLSKPGKIAAYKKVFGVQLTYEELPSEFNLRHNLGCHSVFTGDYSDAEDSPSKAAYKDLVNFFQSKLIRD